MDRINFKPWRVIPVIILTFAICSCSSRSTNDEDGAHSAASDSSTASDTPDSGPDSDTIDNDIDAGDDTETATYDYEMIQNLEEALDSVSEMVVYEETLYFTFAGNFVLCRVDVAGEQEFECMSELVGDLTVFNGYLWWDSGGGGTRYLPGAEEIDYFSLGDLGTLILAFTVDEDGMYFANHGCKNIIGMSHDGDIVLHENLEYEGHGSYLPYVTTNETHVYCSGSSGASFTAGKLYRVPKSGGEVVEVTRAPTTDETNREHSTGPMQIVDDTLYYFHFYTGGDDIEPLWLLSAPAEGGKSTILFEATRYIYESPLVYDASERSLYFTVWQEKFLYKYEIDAHEMKSVPIEYDPFGQIAVDDTYIYWYMNKRIYRMEKF